LSKIQLAKFHLYVLCIL